ncbi:MAG TPA: cytochrome c-type biogenesis protein CcmH [bacterium]|nr:cytochrome c-type biogenesis protein CcmH [bacterium]
MRRACPGRGTAVLVAAAIVAGLIAAAAAATLDDRVYAVARQLLCPVCQGQTVAESDAAVAREMRTIIRQKLEAGETPDLILRYFVGQFGESVLAEPPRRGVSWLLYLGPFAALAAGFALAAVTIRRWAGGPRAASPPPPAAADPADLERLARDLDARDR